MGSEYNLWSKSCPPASVKIERRQEGERIQSSRIFLISHISPFLSILNPCQWIVCISMQGLLLFPQDAFSFLNTGGLGYERFGLLDFHNC